MVEHEFLPKGPNPLDFSESLTKAKNRFFYFSLVIIFITVFEPTLTGFLGNFSIKVNAYPHLFVAIIYVILFWLAVRYFLLIAYEYPSVDFINSPKQARANLSDIWGTSQSHLDACEKEIKELIKYLTDNDISESYDSYYEATCSEVEPNDQANTELCSKLLRIRYLRNDLPKLKTRMTNVRRIIFMDLLFPLLIGCIALISLTFSANDISKRIFSTDSQKNSTYKITSGEVEVKNIKLEKLNP